MSRSAFSFLSAVRTITDAGKSVGRSLEKLATGKRINRASDDPSGVVAVDQMAERRRAIEGRMKRLEREGFSWGAKDGALSALSDLVDRLNFYVVAAANVGATGELERRGMQDEAESIVEAIDHLASTEKFGGELVLEGWRTGSMGVTDGVGLAEMRDGGRINLLDGDMELAQKVVKAASASLAEARADGGLRVKSIDSEIRSLQEEMINLADAQSRIEDVDYAQEVSELVRRQVLESATQFVMKMMLEQHRSTVAMLLG